MFLLTAAAARSAQVPGLLYFGWSTVIIAGRVREKCRSLSEGEKFLVKKSGYTKKTRFGIFFVYPVRELFEK